MISDTNSRSNRLPLTQVILYGPPVVGASVLLFFVTFFVMNFGTDYLGFEPAVIGTVFAIGRLWDAIADPIVGTWSDRVRTRWGRRRPFMLAAIPILFFSILMIYSPPSGLEGDAFLLWFAAALFLFYSGVTAYLVPHQALGAELVRGYHDRTRVFGVRAIFFQLGIFCAFAFMQLVISAGENGTKTLAAREMAGTLALGLALGTSVIMLIPIVGLREPHPDRPVLRPSAGGTILAVLGNAHARIVLTVTFVEMLGLGVLGSLAPYLAKYILHREDLAGILPAVSVGTAMLSVPIWVWLSRRYGKKPVWLVSMIGVAIGYGLLGLVQAGDVGMAVGCLTLAGTSSGCGFALGPSILADVIDADEFETGARNEGAYSAAYGFAIKSAGAIVVFILGWVLQLSGFVANQAEQPPMTEMAIRLLLGGLPFVAYIIGAFIFSRYRLSEGEHQRIQRALNERADAPLASTKGADPT